jgi:hypothetical protein
MPTRSEDCVFCYPEQMLGSTAAGWQRKPWTPGARGTQAQSHAAVLQSPVRSFTPMEARELALNLAFRDPARPALVQFGESGDSSETGGLGIEGTDSNGEGSSRFESES